MVWKNIYILISLLYTFPLVRNDKKTPEQTQKDSAKQIDTGVSILQCSQQHESNSINF